MRVSARMPAHSESSMSVPAQIALLTHDLALPEAQEPETRLRVLTILGMLEVNYDAGMARKHGLMSKHWQSASTIICWRPGPWASKVLPRSCSATLRQRRRMWSRHGSLRKTADPGAHIRYASMYGAGLVEMRKYKEALGPLDEAIKVAKKTRGAAYPTIAITAKSRPLVALGRPRKRWRWPVKRCGE